MQFDLFEIYNDGLIKNNNISASDINVLVACEESQAVTIEFRKLGFNAFSCDLQECSGGYPEWHFKESIFDVLNSENKFDLLIAHPPCTHIAVSGARHFPSKIEDGRQQEAIDFFMKIANSNVDHIAIENPVCIMSSKYKKPSQIIQPWQFGDEFQKTTCLWLKKLPRLKHTEIVGKGEMVTFKSGKKMSKWMAESFGDGKKRSKTFQGIAKAMAEQWGEYLIKEKSASIEAL